MNSFSATRAARAGDGVIGVSSSKIASERSPLARVPTMLDPEVWMNGLPLPASASEQGDDRALVVGARGVDDDVGGLRRLRQNVRVIERAQHRLDAACANRLGLVRRANQARHLMAGGDRDAPHRSADIARCAAVLQPRSNHRAQQRSGLLRRFALQ